MKTFLLCLLCTAPFFSFSQDEHFIELKKQKLDTPLNGYYIDSVFSVTEDSVYLGPVDIGASNITLPGRFHNSISEEFTSLLRQSGLMKPNGKPLTLRINTLKIWEIRPNFEFSLVVLNASFLQKKNGMWTELFQGTSSFRRSDIDVTHLHDDNITEALQNVIKDFNQRLEQKRLRPYPVEKLTADPNSGRPYYALFRKGLQKGFYQTFYDLRDQFPDNNIICEADYHYKRKDSSRVELSLKIPGTRKLDYPWAYCNGKKYFLKMGKYYYPVEFNDSVIFSRYHAAIGEGLSEGASSAIIFSGSNFGTTDAAIAGTIAAIIESKSATETTTFPMPLSFITGNLEKEDFMEDLKVQSHNLFYLSTTAKKGTTVTVSIGPDSHTLAPGEFFRTDLNPHFGKIILTSSTGISQEAEITPRLFAGNLFLIRLTKDEIGCERVYGEERDDILKIVEAMEE